MELWGGHECTVNRVGDRYRDQTRLTGHQDRIEDLARFAELGVVRLRYPALWERIAPDRPDSRDWRWTDERLAEIDRLGMQPILGLLHHGGGPRYTSLVSDDFADLFAGHAAATARRYPHVRDWTPVNEPLTTARFSALYGFWYPHARDERLFWLALLNQVDATRAAMRAIRAAIPDARLVQTEDLGEYHATGALADVAAHFNHRRWATWDLLTGRLTPDHPLWAHLSALGFGERLRAIADDPCPPDLIGVNFYPTSERFLDHRLDRYAYDEPEEGYHDLTAARVLDPPTAGLHGLLRQAWDRYRLPLAVTECHLGCSREEQLRWLWQSWQACRALEREGVDVRALTAWALLGNVDWNSLITREAGHYEPGAFDVSGAEPRPTAIARLLRTLGTGGAPDAATFPALAGPGWWERDIRLEHPPVAWTAIPRTAAMAAKDGPPVVVTGAGGALGQAFVRECELRGLTCYAIERSALPDADLARLLDEQKPWAVIDAAGSGEAGLAAACALRGIHCTILPAMPDAEPRLASFELQQDAGARAGDGALTIRSAAGLPPHRGDLVRACMDLVVDGERGVWQVHDTSPARASRAA